MTRTLPSLAAGVVLGVVGTVVVTGAWLAVRYLREVNGAG